MTERKRRKIADALARLSASVGDIRSLGEELSAIVKPDGENRIVPLRVAASQPPSAAQAKKPTAANPASASLMSLVTATAIKGGGEEDAKDAEKNWREQITQLVKELAPSDSDAQDRCSRLLRRYDSLVGTVRLYETKLKQQSNDVALSEKVESQLEQEESAWEQAMAQRERHVVELQSELRDLQRAAGNPEDEAAAKDHPDADIVMESEVAAMENQGLRETLLLRQEEKQDIEAAIQSMRRRKRRRDGAVEAARFSLGRESQLRGELAQLLAEKEELQSEIMTMEAEQEQAEQEQHGVAALKQALEQSKTQRQDVQDQLDKQKHFLTRMKAKMKHMVDVQLMSARDTDPPTISEEMMILHLLYENAGEMDMNALKQATTETLATYGKATSSAGVLRAIYSLVGSLAVHIDRSIGNGVVTSLLV